MSKVYNYMMLSVGLTFLLKFAGIPAGGDFLIEWLGLTYNVSDISYGQFFLLVSALFTIGTGTGIAIGILTKSPTESYIIAPIALGIFLVICGTFISILNYVQDVRYIFYMMWLVFVPFLASFAIAIINFWRGID